MKTRFFRRCRNFRLAGWGLVFLWCLCSSAAGQVKDEDPFAGGNPSQAPEHPPGLPVDKDPCEKDNPPKVIRVTTPAPAASDKTESPDARVRRLLQARVDVVFEGKLREGLEALGRAVGVPVEIVQPEEGEEIDENLPFWPDFRGCTAQGALEFLLPRYELDWTIDQGRVVVFGREDEERWMTTAMLPIENLVNSRPTWMSEGKLVDALVECITEAVNPYNWENVGGPSRLRRTANLRAQLELRGTPETRRGVIRLLRMLETALTAKPPVSAHPFPTEEAVALAALRKRVTLNAKDMPLDEFLATVERRIGAPINVDWWAISGMAIARDTPITFACHELRASDALARVLRNSGLACVCRGGAILVSTDEEFVVSLRTVVFDIGDLTLGNGKSEDVDSLIGCVICTFPVSYWDGTQPTINPIHLKDRSFLVAMIPQDLLDGIAQMFKMMRQSRRTGAKVVRARHEETAAMRKILNGKVTWRFHDEPLENAVKTIAKDLGIPVYLDRCALDDMGIGADAPISLRAGTYTARDALARVLRDLDLTAILEYGGLTIITREQAEHHPETAVFDVSDFVAADRARMDTRSLVKCFTTTVAPRAWRHVPIENVVSAFPTPERTTLIIRRDQMTLDEVTRFLDALRDVQRTKMKLLVVESKTDAVVRKTLTKQVDWSFNETPLQEAIAQVAADLGISVYIDRPALDDVDIDPDKVFLRLPASRRSARQALRKALKPYDMDIIVAHGGLAITTTEQAEGRWKTAIYNVTDLTARPDVTLKSLTSSLRGKIEPECWDHLRPLVLPDGQTVLALAGEERLLEKVEQWLEDIRTQ